MTDSPVHNQPNTLGNVGLALSVSSLVLVFGFGLCALVGVQQGWIQLVGTPLFICSASSAFLGLVGAVLGAGGLFGSNRPRSSAIAGLLLGLSGVCLFFAVLGAVQN